MKDCDNSTRKIHISSNFILSISLLIMFDTLLLRPSLHCNTPLHFTTLHHTSPKCCKCFCRSCYSRLVVPSKVKSLETSDANHPVARRAATQNNGGLLSCTAAVGQELAHAC